MTLFENLYEYMIKIYIVHSIPERLRLSIPLMKEIPKAWQIDTFTVTELIEAIPGVKEASYSYLTGSALILYDANKSDERKIIKSLKNMLRIVGAHRTQLARTKVEELEEAVLKMKEIIKLEMSL